MVLVSCKNKEKTIKNEGVRVVTGFFLIIKMKELELLQDFFPLWELSVAMETRVLIRSSLIHMQSIPHPNDAPDEI